MFFIDKVVKEVCERIQMHYSDVNQINSAHTDDDQKKIDVLWWVGNDDESKFLEYVAYLGLQFLSS